MQHIELELLGPFAAKFLANTSLTPTERSEVIRMAQGFACKESAASVNISPETIRARRKRIYRKLNLSGAPDLISMLLARSLAMLSNGERIEQRSQASTQPEQGESATAPQ